MSRVRIILDEQDGVEGSTWVVSVPVDSMNEWGVWKAADEAAKVFKMNVARDWSTVTSRLSGG